MTNKHQDIMVVVEITLSNSIAMASSVDGSLMVTAVQNFQTRRP